MRSLPLQLGAVVGAFGAGVAIAELAGAISLGVAFGCGQIAFALALAWVLLRT